MIDEKQSISFGYFQGSIAIVMGVIIVPIGISGLFSMKFDYFSLVFILLSLSGLLLITGGIQAFISARKKEAFEKELKGLESSNQYITNAENVKTSTGSEIIGSWDIDENTWQQFIKNEKKYRNQDNAYLLVGFILLGTITLVLNRNSSWTTALITCFFAGMFIVLIRRSMGLKKIQSIRRKKQVLITERFVRLNEFTFILFSEDRMTSSVKFKESEIPKILEFKIHWKTRNGSTYDELRVPVPPSMEELAKKISYNFINQNNIS